MSISRSIWVAVGGHSGDSGIQTCLTSACCLASAPFLTLRQYKYPYTSPAVRKNTHAPNIPAAHSILLILSWFSYIWFAILCIRGFSTFSRKSCIRYPFDSPVSLSVNQEPPKISWVAARDLSALPPCIPNTTRRIHLGRAISA